MKKAMISQPMRNLTDEQIMKVKNEATEKLREMGYEVINSFFRDHRQKERNNVPVAYLAKAIDVLAEVDLLYCCSGWQKARGCRIEHDIAVAYGIEIIEE